MDIRIALIDDDISLLETLKQDLQPYNQLQIIFSAHDGAHCLDLLAQIPTEKLPQILLMDISMPKLNGIQTTLQVLEKYPQMLVVIFTSFEDDDKILACIQAGAKGYLLKTEKTAFIAQTLEEVIQGGSLMSPSIARKMFRLLQQNTPTTPNNSKIDILTTREKEILEFVKQGKKYKQIAEILGIEENTIKKHIRNIYEKLGVHDKLSVVKLT
jgi:DNA-binding NarL/FixJ family response regulator